MRVWVVSAVGGFEGTETDVISAHETEQGALKAISDYESADKRTKFRFGAPCYEVDSVEVQP